MWIAFTATADNSVVTLDGGTINVEGMLGMDWNGEGGSGTLNLNDGLLNLAQIEPERSIGPNCQIIIDQGIMQVAGEHETTMQNFVDNGRIVSSDGNAISVTYDGTFTQVKKGGATNINSLAVDVVSIYPNPVYDDNVFVEFGLESLSEISLTILDMNGSKVSQPFSNRSFEPGSHKLNIPLVNIVPGTYFMQITFDGISQTHRIIVI